MYIDKIPKPALVFPIKCFPSDRVDTFSTALIPDGIPFPNHDIVAIKTFGNGNCLYNSVSYLLCRNNRLSSALRLLTAAELYLNANNYAHHPKLLASIEDPEINYEPETLFSILLTDEAACAETTDNIELVKLEAKRTAED